MPAVPPKTKLEFGLTPIHHLVLPELLSALINLFETAVECEDVREVMLKKIQIVKTVFNVDTGNVVLHKSSTPSKIKDPLLLLLKLTPFKRLALFPVVPNPVHVVPVPG